MKITKPDDVLLLQGYHARGGRPALMVIVAYVVDADGTRMPEQDVWPWLLTHFPDEPFDTGFKKDRAVFGVAGAAHAPAGQSVQAMSVRAQVGSLQKTLHIHGDRFWDHGLAGWQISPATPFTSMLITLSRAFGGEACPENPYGTGHFAGSEPVQGLPLPNIELPDNPIVSPADRPAVATFSVLPAGARSRMKWVGQVDSAWERERFPWLPDDTDPRWFDGVLSDQGHDGYWQGTEAWSVHGMNATHTEVSGQLPGLRPRLLVRRQQCHDQRLPAGEQSQLGAEHTMQSSEQSWQGDERLREGGGQLWHGYEQSRQDIEQPGPATEAVMDLDTVWLFPNEQRVMVMYRAAVAVAREDAADIAALGVFTELVTDTPRTTAQWDQHWREHDESVDADAMMLETPDSEQDDPELAQIRADHQAATQEWSDSIQQDIQDSLDEGAREANQAMDRLQKDMASIADLGLPRIVAPRISALSFAAGKDTRSMGPEEFEAYLEADIQASLDEGEAAMEAAVRDVAQQMDMDADDLMEQVMAARQNASLADDKTLLEHIAGIDMPDDVRDEVLSKAQVFQNEMDAMQGQLDAAFGKPIAAQQPSAQAVVPALVTAMAGVPAASHAGSAPADHVNAVADTTARHGSETLSATDVQTRAAAGQPLSNTVLTGLDLKGVDLGAADLTGAIITDCDFSDAMLCDAVFERAVIKGCTFNGADLGASAWNEVDVENTGFARARLEQASLTDATFLGCQFDYADLSHAVLNNSSIGESTLHGARLVQASLGVTTIWACTGTSADFSCGRLAGVRIDSECNFTQSSFAQADLRGCSLQKSSFSEANFNEADLSDAFVYDCDLSGTTGWRAKALRTDFKNSRFSNARWIAANLFEASFDYAVLENMDLSGANLHAIETRTAYVRGVQVQGALLSRTRLLQEHATGGGAQ